MSTQDTRDGTGGQTAGRDAINLSSYLERIGYTGPLRPTPEVLAGFLNDDGEARGRPVGLAVDATGALLVADDVGNTVWRLTPR